VADPDITLRFTFRLNGTVATDRRAQGSYTGTITADGFTGALAGGGTFQGQVRDDVNVALDGQLRDPALQCHMTLNIFELPPAAPTRALATPALPGLLAQPR